MSNLYLVIPCFNEPDVTASINSIANCLPPENKVHVVVVINSGEGDSDEILHQNLQSKQDLEQWKTKSPVWLELIVLWIEKVPQKIAGVGNARKVGMDYCIDLMTDNRDAIIICYDADCNCSQNYLTEIEKEFKSKQFEVATIYYEHRFSHEDGAIIPYELFLRYHFQGLRYANYPYAYQTIGSSMAVTAKTYVSFGGMNQRKAGEDFYFLHKIIPYRSVGEINTCAVYPSGRSSDRVPFGTGHAVEKVKSTVCKTYYTYSPAIYVEIAELVNWVQELTCDSIISLSSVSSDIQSFLIREKFERVVLQFQKQSKTDLQFRTSIFRWLNGFRMLKLVHYLRDKSHTNIPINTAASLLWKLMFDKKLSVSNTDWLEKYRSLEKEF